MTSDGWHTIAEISQGLISDLFCKSMLIEEWDRLWEEVLPLKGRLRLKSSDSSDMENVLHLDCSLAQGYPGGHHVCINGSPCCVNGMPFLDIYINYCIYWNIWQPWGPLHEPHSAHHWQHRWAKLELKEASSSLLSGTPYRFSGDHRIWPNYF